MYKNLNDYEILYMIKEEDNSFECLYSKYYPLIYNYVRKYEEYFKRYGYDIDDLIQIGSITLYKTSILYNTSDNSLFYTYFKSSLKNALINEIRINKTLKKETLNNAFSYDVKINNSDISYIEVIPCKENKIDSELIKLIINFKNAMPYEMAWVFELFYNGYQINEIAVLLSKKVSIIRKYLREIKDFALTYRYLFLS